MVLAVRGAGSFYFSHDERAFDVATLIDLENSTMLDDEGNPTDEPIDVTKFSFGLGTQGATADLSPADVYAKRTTGSAYQFTPIYVYYEDILVSMTAYPEVYVGVKGDANLDGNANASDAAAVLLYAANKGANVANTTLYSSENALLERFAYFLADVDGESDDYGVTNANGTPDSMLNATDAAYILLYSAMSGAGEANWVGEDADNSVFAGAPYPAISKAIYDAKKNA